MAALGVLLKHSFAKQNDQPTFSPGPSIDLQEGRHFLSPSSYLYWIGLSYSEEHRAWLWEDNSTLSKDLFLLSHPVNPKSCIIYNPSYSVLDENCRSKYRYICKQWLI
ncbi:Natural killer cells antigen CD94 [Camelus dromedarius]|uniref:Natural killer cells antigen CD94 n=1 Tax=Camelus dromedarius TaxID=9838 RepID=A0A5N4C671_CAMDR|nr:Natural killer cells antigen CD94 [Camelus dromedarius]